MTLSQKDLILWSDVFQTPPSWTAANLQQVEKSFVGQRAEQRVGDSPQGKGTGKALEGSKCVGNTESRCSFNTVMFEEFSFSK